MPPGFCHASNAPLLLKKCLTLMVRHFFWTLEHYELEKG